MTRDEYELRKDDPCQQCGSPVTLEHNPNNNSLQVVCSNAACRWHRRPWQQVIALKRTAKKTRVEYPPGESLDEVWARFGDVCVVCSAPKHVLIRLGIGRQRQHVLPYAQHGHRGPLVPMCVPCHENATARQKLFWFFYRRTDVNESVPGGRPSVPSDGLSPDPLRVTRETPVGAVEGFSDDDAHR